MYYLKKDYQLLGFKKSDNKDKMYYALIQNKENLKKIKVHFGHPEYENYRDITGVNAYPHLIHNDKERRERYRKRAESLVKDDYYSPSYFSFYYLW
jgi:hypothetical protein